MTTRCRALEHSPYSQLLKATDVLKKPAEPGDIHIGRTHALGLGNLLAQVRHTHRVIMLHRDARVTHIESRHVTVERTLRINPIQTVYARSGLFLHIYFQAIMHVPYRAWRV